MNEKLITALEDEISNSKDAKGKKKRTRKKKQDN